MTDEMPQIIIKARETFIKKKELYLSSQAESEFHSSLRREAWKACYEEMQEDREILIMQAEAADKVVAKKVEREAKLVAALKGWNNWAEMMVDEGILDDNLVNEYHIAKAALKDS